ncbi:unnamed protein product [Adineta steineri]|uniref:RING-type domain-containing protein n=1 Tax=Adineta steineri TaxID=433720 RepID=A0A819BSE9_9BILA|nr:unnamed protein product [Adineta steineri]CAF3806110.1 unnamed protein product [Adineta steineri]
MQQRNPAELKVTQTSSTQQLDDELDRSYPICLQLFDDDQCRQIVTSCNHSFCSNCLQRTLQIKPFCPLCCQYQNQGNHNNQSLESSQLDQNTPWNLEVVRALFSEETTDENGHVMRNVLLSNGESTNIHVSRAAQINISPSTNLIINGKRIQNPSDCNQQ